MAQEIESPELSLAAIYSQKVRPLRTRSCSLDIAERPHEAVIQHTLLGIELKVGKRRFACPDLATARYMLVFARLGCREFAIPYDITRISVLADELETAWQKALLTVAADTRARSDTQRKRLQTGLVRRLRDQINLIGPGEKMPEFKQSTKQRTT